MKKKEKSGIIKRLSIIVNNEEDYQSIEVFEVVIQHINIAFFTLQLPLDWLVLCLHYLHLLYVFLPSALQTSLQEVPEDQIDQPVHQEAYQEQNFREEAKEAIVLVECQVSIDLIAPGWLKGFR